MSRTLADWLARLEARHPTEIELGLDRVGAVYARLDCGRPAAHVITIAGTNGKGSTVAFVEAIVRAAGWRVGAYTSPHLLAYNERVRIDGENVTDAALVEAFEAVEAARGDTPLTYFETGTLAALWLFARADLDLVVLEVGLGGRLDAVNIVEPDVSVITTVGLDHQDWLGDDIETIGLEKAGIARAWKPLVLGDTDPPASVLQHAYRIGAVAIRGGSDFLYAPTGNDTWTWREVGFEIELPMPSLVAPVQLRNAAVAVAAVRALDRELPFEAFAAGIAGATVAARLQRFERAGVEIAVDVAHNPQAAQALGEWLQAAPVEGRTCAVYAALADKDVAGVVETLAPWIACWHLAGLSGPRAQDAAALRARFPAAVDAQAVLHDDVATALDTALAQAAPGDRILVFGSFHTAAAALARLQGGR
ncbi:bifunctional tetrahydrofolate synthase/dihydrofolate synthase [Lysobacteraceae bacterium NML93-0399]|nr:bifunctional tetrahydrofolate synthase/dihydrofolate synthase [Xanthomonadaceae bacterium NML93-0399]